MVRDVGEQLCVTPRSGSSCRLRPRRRPGCDQRAQHRPRRTASEWAQRSPGGSPADLGNQFASIVSLTHERLAASTLKTALSEKESTRLSRPRAQPRWTRPTRPAGRNSESPLATTHDQRTRPLHRSPSVGRTPLAQQNLATNARTPATGGGRSASRLEAGDGDAESELPLGGREARADVQAVRPRPGALMVSPAQPSRWARARPLLHDSHPSHAAGRSAESRCPLSLRFGQSDSESARANNRRARGAHQCGPDRCWHWIGQVAGGSRPERSGSSQLGLKGSRVVSATM